MEQTLLRLTLPADHRVRPTDLRRIVASMDRYSPALFARDVDGRTVAYPGIRFVGGGGWVGVVCDAEHEHELMGHVGDVILGVSKAVGQPCEVKIEKHQLGLARSSYPINYVAVRMAIKRRRKTSRDAELDSLVVDRVLNSIERTAAHVGIDCPTREELEIHDVKIVKNSGLQLETDQGLTAEWVTLCTAKFSIFADLRGMWFAGNLTARGFGSIKRELGLLQGLKVAA